ncbi:PREDICTED: uncharacterized protein LOC105461266, partial [Wasmannia auropunctata]|uniref:uncharacterized protein LOC105461266 n=1 Tax=Wasmannia auropunctata TaxID=64793 RepID=UPI0005F019FF
HKSADCKDKSKGRKCFKCNKFGHISTECKGKNTKENAGTSVNNVLIQLKRMRIMVNINNKDVEALVDTGSQPNLLREDVYQDLGEPELKKTDLRLHGFGQSCILPRGYFTAYLRIDGDNFETNFYVVSQD